MFQPTAPLSPSKAVTGLINHYLSKKDEYLELCWQYNLPPRDLTLLLMGRREIEAEDRIKLIRLIIQLSDMEKLLDRGALDDYLFPSDEADYSHSAIFSNNIH